MCFVCSGRNQNAFRILFQKIACKRDGFLFYETGLSLLKGLLHCNANDTLVILEYDLYKGFSDFIFDFLREKRLKIPMILIGNPRLSSKICSERWICENELQYNVQTLHALHPILRRISLVFESEEIQVLFKADFSNLPAPESESVRLESLTANPIETLRRNLALPPSIFNILLYLYKNRRREVSVEEIEKLLPLSSESEKTRKNSAYTYISRLRKCMENTQNCTFQIVRTRKGFYQLVPK